MLRQVEAVPCLKRGRQDASHGMKPERRKGVVGSRRHIRLAQAMFRLRRRSPCLKIVGQRNDGQKHEQQSAHGDSLAAPVLSRDARRRPVGHRPGADQADCERKPDEIEERLHVRLDCTVTVADEPLTPRAPAFAGCEAVDWVVARRLTGGRTSP